MDAIKVNANDLHKAVKAFELLFHRYPTIYTCDRFTDSFGEAIFGTCEVINVMKVCFIFEADGFQWTAKIKDCEYFYFS